MVELKILFIGYWSIDDPLTVASIFPWLKVMQASERVAEVVFCSIEREETQYQAWRTHVPIAKVKHVPLYSEPQANALSTKINDFVQFPRMLEGVVAQHKVNVLFAHGAPAGALAYKVWKRTNLPFFVSSFEPHADYMAESGVWRRAGLKYIFQKYWERQQLKHAAGLMPVTDNYREFLLAKGVPPAKIKSVPCIVDLKAFAFKQEERAKLRERLGWQESTIGIYVGKYGGLYYDTEAFNIYRKCFELVPAFKLILLSPQPVAEVQAWVQASKLDSSSVYIAQAKHTAVAQYLSAADFALATYKPGPSKKYLSPIKIGEYWANGLPVLLTKGVGDDSDIIRREGGGATFNLQEQGSVEQAIKKIVSMIKDPKHRQEIPKLAQKYRSPERLQEAFDYFFGGAEVGGKV